MTKKKEIKKPTLMEDGSLLLKDEKIKWTERFNICEKAEKGGWIKIGGTAVEAVTSKNNRKYLAEELAKQEIRGKKVFVDHEAAAMNAVGVIEAQSFDGQKLKYEAKITNTQKNPGVLDMVEKGLITDVSIGATGDIKQVREDNNSVFEIHNLKIEELSLVGIGGVPGAGIDYTTAISEKFDLKENDSSGEIKKETEKFYKMNVGGHTKWLKVKQ